MSHSTDHSPDAHAAQACSHVTMARSQTRPVPAHLEARRLRAVGMVARGISQAEVARRLGVTREAVRQWVAAWNTGGRAALAPRPRGKQGRVALARVAHVIE